LRLLFAGRMESLKGGTVLLDALPLVSSALSRPLVLTFAGDGSGRFGWARRADAIVRRHPAMRIEFTGWIEPAALAALFDSSDLLVVPSLWPEPFGLVGPEAGMRGLPAAAFAAGGIPEWLTDGVNGALAYGLPPAAADLADCDRALPARSRRACAVAQWCDRIGPALQFRAASPGADGCHGPYLDATISRRRGRGWHHDGTRLVSCYTKY
jgi:glycosyltransferase involved in cell wall biosynthesis